MKRNLFIIIALLCGIGVANASVRDANSPKRAQQQAISQRTNVAVQRNNNARTANNKIISRSTTTTKQNNNRGISTRVHPTTATTNNTNPTPATTIIPRKKPSIRPSYRAAISVATPASNTFNIDYNTCREAYFTCMDQFCASANDTYRRCICSSKLSEIQSRERALSQTSEQLQDFKTFNLYAIDKTAAEVGAMVSASIGEAAQENITDKSNSAAALSAITDVLSKTKSNAQQNEPDFTSNVNLSWGNSELIGGTNISNLTGEALYNSVNAQCVQMVSDSCPNEITTQMVVSAYGMYIENDCSLIINGLDTKKKSANSEIRKTEYEMGSMRLDNYNVHNSSSINDCLAMIRKDMTSETACGKDYIHCLDITGKYLNYQTGEPIYSANFYELNNATSLTGDVLKNDANTSLITTLNQKKIFAEKSLNTCRDLSEDVWDEFLRQAISEIHQGQQDRIRTVKKECLDTIISCYDTQNEQLIDFSNVDKYKLLGARLELSESMCQEKLTTCSNLYGGGPNGLQKLVTEMKEIVNLQIANECRTALDQMVLTLCSPSEYESNYSFPFACRAYTPGNQICATLTTEELNENENCKDYNGSLYQKISQYALEICVRPSETTLSASVLQDVNDVMNNIRIKMNNVLTTECEKLNGRWIQYNADIYSTPELHMPFYSKTPAHEKWGVCSPLPQ